jgi:hypothetical protein
VLPTLCLGRDQGRDAAIVQKCERGCVVVSALCWVYGLAAVIAVYFVPFCGRSPIVPTGVIQLLYISASMSCIVSGALGCAKLLYQIIMTDNGRGDAMAGGCVYNAATACSFCAPHSLQCYFVAVESGGAQVFVAAHPYSMPCMCVLSFRATE